jgi:hypothetical protein
MAATRSVISSQIGLGTMQTEFRWALVWCAAAWLCAGCSQGPATGTVNGEVTLDGKPLPTGHLQFVPLDGQGQTGGTLIADGKFSAQVPVAKMKVEIHANKVIGKRKAYDTPESPWEEEVAELLPPKYNFKSDLTLDVKRGKQEVKYDLKSK